MVYTIHYPFPNTAFVLGQDRAFPLQSTILARIGLNTQYEQYAFYGSTVALLYPTIPYMRKVFYTHKFLHEKIPEDKYVWASRAGLNEVDIKNAEKMLEDFRKVPRRWATLTASFIVIEIISKSYKLLHERFMKKK